MEYEYAKYENDIIYHIIRVHYQEGITLQGNKFKDYIKQNNGEGIVVLAIRGDNGLYNLTSEVPLSASDKDIDDLDWVEKTWSEEVS